MSLETECKKVANNLQQLCDAVVTLTAELQIKNGTVSPKIIPDEIKETPPPGTGTEPSPPDKASQADRKPIVPAVTQPVASDEQVATTEQVKPKDNVVSINSEPMSPGEANAAINDIVQQIGTGGLEVVQAILHRNNAVSMLQIAPENYNTILNEARALIPVDQQ